MARGILLNIDTTKSEFQNPMVQLRQGDGNYQSLSVTVTSNGEPFDLTGWTITFMGTTAGGFKIVDAASVVTNASQGEFTYTPTKAWGQDEGEFKNAYFKFVKSDETASGASFRVNVLDAVDLTAEEAGNYISVVDQTINKLTSDLSTLRTSVNDLKAQNNNIKTSDNTWTGNNTFTQPVNGALATRQATFTDFNDVAKNMVTFSGSWVIGSQSIANSPLQNYYTATITPAFGDGGSGYIELVPFASGSSSKYIAVVGSKTLSSWRTFSFNDGVVHNTGDETISGNKTFTGLSTFAQNIQGNLTGNSGTTTKLQTPRRINGTNFDGTADITVDPVVKYINTDTDLFTLSNGFYYFDGVVATNKPASASNYFTVEVIQTATNGFMRLVDNNSSSFWTTKNLGYWWNSWHKDADDSTVVHNTGTETIAGNKTFTGNNSFKGVQVLAQSTTVEFNMWYGSKMKATRFGNLVVLGYSQNPTQDIPSGITSQETVPTGFRPSFDWYMSQGGVSTSGGSSVKVKNSGNLSVVGPVSVSYPYTMTATYFTSDPFPS